MNEKPSFIRTADTERLIKLFTQHKRADIISYADMNALCPGRKFNGKDRHILASARRILVHEHNMDTGAVAGYGIKVLEQTETLARPDDAIRRTHRLAKREAHKVKTVDYETLPNQDKTKFNLGLSMLGAIAQFTSGKSQKAISQGVDIKMAKLTTAEALRAALPMFDKEKE